MSVKRKRKRYSDSDTNSSFPENYASPVTPPIVIRSKNREYIGSALNREKSMILIYGVNKHTRNRFLTFRRQSPRYFLLFTAEGELITMYLNKDNIGFHIQVSIHFDSDCIMILSSEDDQFNHIYMYSDYISSVTKIEGRVFDCDKSGDIYMTTLQLNPISIYSPDVIFKDFFEINTSNTGSGSIVGLSIEDDVLLVGMKYCMEFTIGKDLEYRLHRYCLKTGELLQMIILRDRLNLPDFDDVWITDRFTNVIMDCDKSRGFCVWSTDRRICYCGLKKRISNIKIHVDAISCSLTDTFRLICVSYSGVLKIRSIL